MPLCEQMKGIRPEPSLQRFPWCSWVQLANPDCFSTGAYSV